MIFHRIRFICYVFKKEAKQNSKQNEIFIDTRATKQKISH